MIVYWLLLLPVAFIAYVFGSFDSLVLASNFVFHRDLKRLGTGDQWLSNFRRLYGLKGALLLLLVELVKDLVPIGLGGLLLLIKGHAPIGFAFAGFCLVLGRLYPVFYGFRGGQASIALTVLAFFCGKTIGAFALLVLLLTTWFSRYFSLGAFVEAMSVALIALLMATDPLVGKITAIAAALVMIKHVPAMIRIIQHREFRFSKQEDLSYKLDEKF